MGYSRGSEDLECKITQDRNPRRTEKDQGQEKAEVVAKVVAEDRGVGHKGHATAPNHSTICGVPVVLPDVGPGP